MSGLLPGGDKLPKIKVTEYDLDVTLTTVIGGVAIAKLGGMETLGIVVAGIGCLSTIIETRRLFNPYKALFENCNMIVGNQVPRYINKRKSDYGYTVTFSLPFGMSTDDFEKKKLAIEQYLNKRIEISYNNYRVFMKVYEKQLEKSPKYHIPEVGKKVLEFNIGIGYGKDVKVDLQEIVHLLIAGETGSAKSTLLRGIITSLILNKRVELHLIDLKNGAEFNVFRKCKQVKTFSRNIEEAEQVLSDLLIEVERRYDLFYENNVVDIKEYNQLRNIRRLGYQVVIVDEFADLQDEKGSISAIERLAAKARACGIHLIIATQRPDAKILNGRIKANIPGIIGLKTMNELNSRIIIDDNGLEKLRGKGHGYFKFASLTEFQAYFLTVAEARDLIKDFYIEKKKEVKKVVEIKDFDFLSGIK